MSNITASVSYDEEDSGDQELAIERGTGDGTREIQAGNDVQAQAGNETLRAILEQLGSLRSTVATLNNKVATQDDVITTQGDVITTQGDKITTQGDKITKLNNKVATQDDVITTQGDVITTQGDKITKLEKELRTVKGELTAIKKTTTEGEILDSFNTQLTEKFLEDYPKVKAEAQALEENRKKKVNSISELTNFESVQNLKREASQVNESNRLPLACLHPFKTCLYDIKKPRNKQNHKVHDEHVITCSRSVENQLYNSVQGKTGKAGLKEVKQVLCGIKRKVRAGLGVDQCTPKKPKKEKQVDADGFTLV